MEDLQHEIGRLQADLARQERVWDSVRPILRAVGEALGKPIDPRTPEEGEALAAMLRRVAVERDEARAELDDENRALLTFRRLVERTAAALGLVGERFDPELGELCLPSWHDIPERVERLIRERDEARAEIEELRRAEAAALYLPEGGADLGFEAWSEGWVKQVGERDEYGETDETIVIEDFSACAHPEGDPYRRSVYHKNSLISCSFYRSPRAAMKAGS